MHGARGTRVLRVPEGEHAVVEEDTQAGYEVAAAELMEDADEEADHHAVGVHRTHRSGMRRASGAGEAARGLGRGSPVPGKELDRRQIVEQGTPGEPLLESLGNQVLARHIAVTEAPAFPGLPQRTEGKGNKGRLGNRWLDFDRPFTERDAHGITDVCRVPREILASERGAPEAS